MKRSSEEFAKFVDSFILNAQKRDAEQEFANQHFFQMFFIYSRSQKITINRKVFRRISQIVAFLNLSTPNPQKINPEQEFANKLSPNVLHLLSWSKKTINGKVCRRICQIPGFLELELTKRLKNKSRARICQ